MRCNQNRSAKKKGVKIERKRGVKERDRFCKRRDIERTEIE